MHYTLSSSLTPAFVQCLLRTAISNTMHSVTIAHCYANTNNIAH